MQNKKNLFLNLFFFLSIFLLFLEFFKLSLKVDYLVKEKKLLNSSANKTENKKVNIEDLCETNCKDRFSRLVSEEVSHAVATLSSKLNTEISVKEVKINTSKKTSYIPMGTSFSTTSTSWTEIPDSGVYIDLLNDYGDKATVSWETSLKVAHGNGKSYARLYDNTNKIAVDFSELSTEKNANYQQVSSGNLPFWRGRNLYKVQIKSLNSFEITYSGGKIKIIY